MDEFNLLKPSGNLLNYSINEILINIGLSIILGIIIAITYNKNHKGLSYSQSYVHMLVLITMIVAIVMMVIGGSLARAFALVGALSIVRFRTVLKDTKDLAFVFAALALGMAAGTSNYFLAIVGIIVIVLVTTVLSKTNFGAIYKSEFVLRFRLNKTENDETYLSTLRKFCKLSNLLHIEQSADGKSILISYDISLRDDMKSQELTNDLSIKNGISEVMLIASKNDIDY